jgi:DNA-binding CsgD family transcriptional regulator
LTDAVVSGAAGQTEGLLERDSELGLIAGLVDSVAAGGDGALFLEGAAGIGKTRLLRRAVVLAEAAGVRVLTATAGELDRGFAYGPVRDLLGRPLALLDDEARESLRRGPAGPAAALLEGAESPGDPFAIRHSLYWLTVELAESGPLLLLVDDAHWADPASIEWLRYLAARMDGTGLGLILAARPVESADGAAATGPILAAEEVTVVRPRSLGIGAVAEMIATALGAEPDEEFAEACLVASGGNPLTLRELLARLAGKRIRPTATALDDVGRAAPREIGRSALDRAAGVEEATAVLKALAVLGPGATVDRLAEVAELPRSGAAEALIALGDLGLVEGGDVPDLAHPLLRRAILLETGPRERAALEARAAAALSMAGAPAEAVAAHLLEADPAGEAGTVAILREVARRAVACGDPVTALACLRRAVAERAEPVDPELRVELGRTMVASGEEGGAEILRAATAEATDPVAAAALALELGTALSALGRDEEAIADLVPAAEALAGDDRELELLIESAIHHAARNLADPDPAVLGRIGRFDPAALAGETLGERAMLIHQSGDHILSGGDAAGGAALAQKAIAGWTPRDDRERLLASLAAGLLIYCDRPGAATAVLDRLLSDARARGSPLGYVFASGFRCYASGQTGDLRQALGDGEAAVDVAESQGIRLVLPIVFASYMTSLVQSGDAAGALALAGRYDALEDEGDKSSHAMFLATRGAAYTALGQRSAAIADLRAAGEVMSRWGVDCPGLLQWRAPLAEALRLDGEDAEARRLAAEEVTLARAFGAPRPLGVALRAQAVVDPGVALPALEEAEGILRPSEARLEHARALAALGAALRRTNRREEARARLLEALDLAGRCGAKTLESNVREELAALGSRPRRTHLRGPDSLTPSERRVAALAGEGSTNREIAQQLFVTIKTVETHLSRVYAKLGIASRAELGEAMAGAPRA